MDIQLLYIMLMAKMIGLRIIVHLVLLVVVMVMVMVVMVVVMGEDGKMRKGMFLWGYIIRREMLRISLGEFDFYLFC